jgi:cytochrome c oxidase subunit 2
MEKRAEIQRAVPKWLILFGIIILVLGIVFFVGFVYAAADEGHPHEEKAEEPMHVMEMEDHHDDEGAEPHEHMEAAASEMMDDHDDEGAEPHEHMDAMADGMADEHADDGHADDVHAEAEGHVGHAHAKESFEIYGLVKAEDGYKEYNIKLERFKYTPEVIKVNKGDRVRLNIDSVDVEHGFYLDGYGIDELIPEKGFKTIEFVATKSGAFRFRCSTTCGPFHPFMVGKMVVGPNFNFWGAIVTAMFIPIGSLVYFRKRGGKNT